MNAAAEVFGLMQHTLVKTKLHTCPCIGDIIAASIVYLADFLGATEINIAANIAVISPLEKWDLLFGPFILRCKVVLFQRGIGANSKGACVRGLAGVLNIIKSENNID